MYVVSLWMQDIHTKDSVTVEDTAEVCKISGKDNGVIDNRDHTHSRFSWLLTYCLENHRSPINIY